MLGKNLKYLRKKHNLSQDFIQDLLGYKSFTTIQKWESGISEPPISKLKELSDLYNVDMDTMYRLDLEKEDYQKKWDINNPDLETNILLTPQFETAKEAVKFILAQPAMASYGGYNIDDMSEEDILEIANNMLFAMKLSLQKNK